MPYSEQVRVPYYECDETARLRASSVARLMQQIAGAHIDSLNIPSEKLYEMKMVFLLANTYLKVKRMPIGGEEVSVATAPIKCKGAKFYRDIIITDKNNELCAAFSTIWILINPDSRKILRPSEFPYQLPFESSLVEGIVSEERLPKVGEHPLILSKEVMVEYSHLDSNAHVNNSFYIDFACNMIPYDELIAKGVEDVVVAYQREAVHQDNINIDCYQLKRGEYHFVGKKNNGPCFEAVIRLNN